MKKDKKVAIVTGANSGVGLEVTKGLLKNGIHVVMACRNLEKANNAKEQILLDLPSSKLEVMIIDLSDFESVRTFAQNFKSKFQRLDILVNNASEGNCKNLEEDMMKLIEKKNKLYPNVMVQILDSRIEMINGKKHVHITHILDFKSWQKCENKLVYQFA